MLLIASAPIIYLFSIMAYLSVLLFHSAMMQVVNIGKQIAGIGEDVY